MKLHGKEIKIGDRVKHINGEEGTVVEFRSDMDNSPIGVKLDSSMFTRWYRMDSTYLEDQRIKKMTLDNIELKAGDDVYSLVHGWVSVKQVLTNYLVVEEKSGATHSILDEGKLVRNGARILYWDIPIITPPERPYKEVPVYQYLYRRKTSSSFKITVNHYPSEELAKTTVAEAIRGEFEFIRLENSRALAKLTPDVERRGITL